MAEGDINNRVSWGLGLSYVFHKNLPNDDQELVDFCDQESLKVVRTSRIKNDLSPFPLLRNIIHQWESSGPLLSRVR